MSCPRAPALVLLLAMAAVACGTAASETVGAPAAASLARWTAFVHIDRPLDVVAGRADRSLVVAAAGRLYLLTTSGRLTPFAPAYQSPGGEEPYIAMVRLGHRGCSYGTGAVFAIRLRPPRGVVRMSAGGTVRQFANVTARGLIDGIAFDETGSFGYRLLVTVNHGTTTTVDAIGCHGGVTTITGNASRVEGGIAVAPASFGRFGGDLIAPDETGGRVFAITPQGRRVLVADSGLPHGQDIGVESEGFVPDKRRFEAFVADRLTPGNRHPGDDVLLRISSTALRRAGVRPADLLVATEGGAFTDAIRCSRAGCVVRHVADGPAIAHVEGHIAFR